MRSRVIWWLFLIGSLAIYAEAGVAAEGPAIAPDESASVTEFIALGVPATDREWIADDYERFISVIRTVSRDHPRGLPRFESEKSAAIMRRVTSEQNFASLHDRKLSLTNRLTQASAFTRATAAIAGIYFDATIRGESFDRELVELLAFIVKVNLELWSLADETLATLTPEERATRARGLDMMRSGSAQVVSGSLTTFTEKQVCRVAELRRFASLIAPTLPLLVQRLTSESRAEAVLRLRTLVAQPPDESLATPLNDLLEAIEGKTKPAANSR